MRRSLRNLQAAAAKELASTPAPGNSPAQLAVKIEDGVDLPGSHASGSGINNAQQARNRKRKAVSVASQEIKSEAKSEELDTMPGNSLAKPKQSRKRKPPTASPVKAEAKSQLLEPTPAAKDEVDQAAAAQPPHTGKQKAAARLAVEVKTSALDIASASEQDEAEAATAGPSAAPQLEQSSKPKRQPRAKTASKAKQPAAAALSNSSADLISAAAAGPNSPSVSASQLADALTGPIKAESSGNQGTAGTAADNAAAEDPEWAEEPAQAVQARKSRAKKVKEAKPTLEEVVASLKLQPYRERAQPRKWVGAHVSMGGGIEKAVVRAAAIGANAFALDTRSKRQWNSPPLEVERAAAFKQACRDFGFGPEHILPHGSYLINLASADPELYDKSYNAFVDELQRCEILGIGLYNFHPGSTCGKCSAEEGMDRIADAINRAHAVTETVVVVLENMAGAGHSVGHKFEYLSYIIDRVHNKGRVGVCLDTCHLFAGGYDVSTAEAFEQVMTNFDEKVGLKYLKGMHVNDSKAEMGSKKDRHQNVAKGQIGKECFEFLMNDSRFDGMPLIMETPVQCAGPNIDFKLSFAASAAVFDLKGPPELWTGINTDKRDIAWLNSLAKA